LRRAGVRTRRPPGPTTTRATKIVGHDGPPVGGPDSSPVGAERLVRLSGRAVPCWRRGGSGAASGAGPGGAWTAGSSRLSLPGAQDPRRRPASHRQARQSARSGRKSGIRSGPTRHFQASNDAWRLIRPPMEPAQRHCRTAPGDRRGILFTTERKSRAWVSSASAGRGGQRRSAGAPSAAGDERVQPRPRARAGAQVAQHHPCRQADLRIAVDGPHDPLHV
jgi:hypothetical protein